jgi:hypothetical protein
VARKKPGSADVALSYIRKRLMALFQMKDLGQLHKSCKDRGEEALGSQNDLRESKWTESIAACPLNVSRGLGSGQAMMLKYLD